MNISKINVNGTSYNITDTKNTAGSTDSSSKLFLIGATSQAANPQTYSQDTAYVGTDGCLYSGGSKVATNSQVSAFGSNGIIDTHGEGTRSIILDSGNDLYAFYQRGGTCTAYEVETSTTLTSATLAKTSTTVATLSAELFNGFLGYNHGPYSGEKFAVYDLILPSTFSWGSTFYWSFGANSWKPEKMRILVAKDSGDYIQKYTSDSCPVFGKTDISNGSTGYNRIRIVMSKYSRLSLLGVRNWNYAGQRTTFMNRTVDDYVYRSITPAKNNNWSLGTTDNYWKNLYVTNINGVALGSSPKFTDTTYSSKSAASEGTDESLVTTGEKYTWNNKQNKVAKLGSTTKPVYTSAAGTFAECSTYAGGTAVTLNGTSKAANTASFYAPTSAGTSGQILTSNGSGTPSWTAAPISIEYTTIDQAITDINATLAQNALVKVQQTLTSSEKTQVLTNLGISTTIDNALVKTSQSLSSSEKTQVLTNLGIASTQIRNVTVSTADPTSNDGNDGDVWLVYET